MNHLEMTDYGETGYELELGELGTIQERQTLLDVCSKGLGIERLFTNIDCIGAKRLDY